jgi:hypothetical protein
VAILDPHPTAVEFHVFIDEREPESGALRTAPSSGDPTAGEALEDEIALFHGHTRAVVLDRDPDRAGGHFVVGDEDGNLDFAATVDTAVVDEVGDDAGEPSFVAADHHVLGLGRDEYRATGETARRYRLTNEFADEQLVDVEADDTGIEARDFE